MKSAFLWQFGALYGFDLFLNDTFANVKGLRKEQCDRIKITKCL